MPTLTTLTDYLDRLQFQHAELEKALTDLPPEALDWKPTPEINSLTVLTIHTAGSERWLIGEILGGEVSHRDREAEFRVHGLEVHVLLARLAEVLAHSQTVIAHLTAADLEEPIEFRGRMVTKSWVLSHCLAHVANHVGEAQVIRQWWQATQAAHSTTH